MTKILLRMYCVCVLLLLVPLAAGAQQMFRTPEEAMESLAVVAKTGDSERILAVLGTDGRDIIFSGDPVADRRTRELFLRAYGEKHTVIRGAHDEAAVLVGKEDWPFPIPLVQRENGWHFDSARGRDEILYRRIGRNELSALQTALAYVDAQYDYATLFRPRKGAPYYAQHIVSTAGKKDGLYWPVASSGRISPLGEFAASAAAEGYGGGKGRRPYHGYYYRILTKQGPAAPGGKVDYIAGGRMIGGFGLIAYPAEYANSGVMTFIVNHDGTVYEKDLGPATTRIASGIMEYNPDKTWAQSHLPVDVAGTK